MINIKEFKKEIITGCIVSFIILFFIQPTVIFIWDILRKISLNQYSEFLDNTYRNAALGQRNWVDCINIYLIFYITFLFISIFSIKFRNDIKEYEHKEKIKSFQNENEKLEYLNNRRNSYDKKARLIKKNLNKIRILTYIVQISVLLIFSTFVFSTFVDLQLNSSFNQRFNIVAPFIDEHEEEVIKAQWASMENRKDYENINNRLNQIALKNKFKLVEPLLK